MLARWLELRSFQADGGDCGYGPVQLRKIRYYNHKGRTASDRARIRRQERALAKIANQGKVAVLADIASRDLVHAFVITHGVARRAKSLDAPGCRVTASFVLCTSRGETINFEHLVAKLGYSVYDGKVSGALSGRGWGGTQLGKTLLAEHKLAEQRGVGGWANRDFAKFQAEHILLRNSKGGAGAANYYAVQTWNPDDSDLAEADTSSDSDSDSSSSSSSSSSGSNS